MGDGSPTSLAIARHFLMYCVVSYINEYIITKPIKK